MALPHESSLFRYRASRLRGRCGTVWDRCDELNNPHSVSRLRWSGVPPVTRSQAEKDVPCSGQLGLHGMYSGWLVSADRGRFLWTYELLALCWPRDLCYVFWLFGNRDCWHAFSLLGCLSDAAIHMWRWYFLKAYRNLRHVAFTDMRAVT